MIKTIVNCWNGLRKARHEPKNDDPGIMGSDGKKWMSLDRLLELKKKYAESKLDPDVLKDVSEDQHFFFMYPHDMTIHDVAPDEKKA